MDYHLSITNASDDTADLDGDTERVDGVTAMEGYDLTGNGGEQKKRSDKQTLFRIIS